MNTGEIITHVKGDITKPRMNLGAAVDAIGPGSVSALLPFPLIQRRSKLALNDVKGRMPVPP